MPKKVLIQAPVTTNYRAVLQTEAEDVHAWERDLVFMAHLALQRSDSEIILTPHSLLLLLSVWTTQFGPCWKWRSGCEWPDIKPKWVSLIFHSRWGCEGPRGSEGTVALMIYPQRELKYDHPWCVCGGGGGVLQRKLDDVRECFTGLFRVKLEKRTLMMSSKILIIELQKTPLWCICAV